MLLLWKVSLLLLLFFSRCGNYLGMFVAVRVVVRFKAVLVGTNYVLYNLKYLKNISVVGKMHVNLVMRNILVN